MPPNTFFLSLQVAPYLSSDRRFSGSTVSEPDKRLAETIGRIALPDEEMRKQTQRAFDLKTKPRGSLGRLETVTCQLAAVLGYAPSTLAPMLVVAAADHGVSVENVSAYPQEVTAQMVANFASGGAAMNVLARKAGARVLVVDAGVVVAEEHPKVRSWRFGAGTSNIAEGPAMTRGQAIGTLVAGIELAVELPEEGVNLVALGEMGIGNTTAASALAAALLDTDPLDVCGPGTGLDEAGIARKAAIVRRALAMNSVQADDPIGALACLGGFEIGVLAGLTLGCACLHIPVVLDGFITGTAALLAARLAPEATGSMIAGHRSPEPGHALVLEALDLDPLLELGLRLGEGSGATLTIQLIGCGVALLNDMATFADSGVTDAGR
jgi:nicotinate-nucleotide--dimethylbenzimidazole phosphoribosyltransferase